MDTARKTAEIDSDDWISLLEASRELDESRQTILNRAVKGEVVAKHFAGRTLVTRASVDAVKAAKENAK